VRHAAVATPEDNANKAVEAALQRSRRHTHKAKSTMNHRAIECHDSTLLSVTLGRDLQLELSAYVHVSEGEPGRDAGTGWEQEFELVLTDAVVEETPPGSVEITDGRIEVDEQVFAGLIPLPYLSAGLRFGAFEMPQYDRIDWITASTREEALSPKRTARDRGDSRE